MEPAVNNKGEQDIPLQTCSGSVSSLTDSLDGDLEELDTKISQIPVLTRVLETLYPNGGEDTCQRQVNGTDKSDLKNGKKECHSTECNGLNQRETITSRMRIKRSHSQHGSEADLDEYLTPTQRKTQTIKDLRKQVKELTKVVEEKEQEIDCLKKSMGKETKSILDMKNKEMHTIKNNLQTREMQLEELTEAHTEAVKQIEDLELTIEGLRVKLEKRERHHGEMYLEMFEKGRQSAEFERKDELEMLAKTRKQKVSTKELTKKLTESQAELAKWQSLQRQEMYTVNDKPETEAETTLKFLKDSFFHFLINDKDSDDHLRAIIEIFNFSDVQKRKMSKALKERRKAAGKS